MARGFTDDTVVAALERSLSNATHLRARDAAAVAAARMLARKIDAWDQIVEFALEDAAEHGGRPVVPANDNVSLASFLKYLEKLGLLPDEQAATHKPAVMTRPQNELEAFRSKRRGAAG